MLFRRTGASYESIDENVVLLISLFGLVSGAVAGNSAIVVESIESEHIDSDPIDSIADSLEQRGKQLRIALEQAYKKMVDEGTLSTDPTVGNDVSAVVIRYIQVGMSFDDAESILRSAGFSVSHPTANPLGKRPDRHDVVGAIEPFEQRLFGGANLYVHLRPASPREYSIVTKVSAGFALLFL